MLTLKQLKPEEIFNLLSDPMRIRILKIVASKEICVGDISKKIGLSLSATSHQLRKLEVFGVVLRCRYGQEICYCINRKSHLANKLIKLIKLIQ